MNEELTLSSSTHLSRRRLQRDVLLYWTVAVSAYVAGAAYCAKLAPWVSSIANSPILFVLGPFAVGALVWQTMTRAVVLGCLCCLTLVGLFYASDDLSGTNSMNWQGLRVYALQAVVVGPASSAAGAAAMRLRGRTRTYADRS